VTLVSCGVIVSAVSSTSTSWRRDEVFAPHTHLFRRRAHRGILILEATRPCTITFDVPEGALSTLRLSPTEFVKGIRVVVALLWYSQGELSQSRAAEICGHESRGVHRRNLASAHPLVQVTAHELQGVNILFERRMT
jgi:uncharacterized protein UPF0175